MTQPSDTPNQPNVLGLAARMVEPSVLGATVLKQALQPPQQKKAPSGYQWDGSRLIPIPGGPADKPNLRVIGPDNFGNVFVHDLDGDDPPQMIVEQGVPVGDRAVSPAEAESVGVPPAAQPAPPPPNAFDAARAGTGPYRALGAALDAVVGGLLSPLGVGSLFPQTTAAREQLRILNQTMKTAFVNNPRFPVAEQETVKGFLVDPDDFWANPETMVQRMIDLRDYMVRRRQQNTASLQNAQITQDERGRLADEVASIDRILGLMGDPNTTGAVSGPVRILNDADFDDLKPGTPFIGPDGVLRIKP